MPKDKPPPEPKRYAHWTQEQYDEKRDEVRRMAQCGCKDDEIGLIIGRSERSVQNNYREELAEGRAHMKMGLRRRQLHAAMVEGNTAMMIWLGKQILGQKEPKQNIEHSGNMSIEKVLYNSIQIEGKAAKIGYDDGKDSTP